MSANKNKAIWFLFTTMLSIFNICTIYIFARNWPFYAVTLNAILSLGGLVFQMHVDDKKQKKLSLLPVRIILWLNSVSVFLMLGLSLFTLTSQYHNHLEPDKTIHSVEDLKQVMEESEEGVYLLETDELYIYYADYNNLSFVAGKRPSKEDESLIMCVAAAFQGSYEPGFSHDNIVGWHASGGQLERGKPEKNLGAFTYVDGEARIFNIEDSEAAIKEAAERGGCGFQQFVRQVGFHILLHVKENSRCGNTGNDQRDEGIHQINFPQKAEKSKCSDLGRDHHNGKDKGEHCLLEPEVIGVDGIRCHSGEVRTQSRCTKCHEEAVHQSLKYREIAVVKQIIEVF